MFVVCCLLFVRLLGCVLFVVACLFIRVFVVCVCVSDCSFARLLGLLLVGRCLCVVNWLLCVGGCCMLFDVCLVVVCLFVVKCLSCVVC